MPVGRPGTRRAEAASRRPTSQVQSARVFSLACTVLCFVVLKKKAAASCLCLKIRRVPLQKSRVPFSNNVRDRRCWSLTACLALSSLAPAVCSSRALDTSRAGWGGGGDFCYDCRCAVGETEADRGGCAGPAPRLLPGGACAPLLTSALAGPLSSGSLAASGLWAWTLLPLSLQRSRRVASRAAGCCCLC